MDEPAPKTPFLPVRRRLLRLPLEIGAAAAGLALEQKGGYLDAPDGPGLGLEVDEAGLAKLRVKA